MKETVVNVRHTAKYDVYVGRGRSPMIGADPSVIGGFGNPFAINHLCTREEVLRLFKQWLEQDHDPRAQWMNRNIGQLKGKTLGCWCKPADCHGDILYKKANK